MQKRRATIIGGEGFIGRHLTARLLSEEWDCFVPDRRETYEKPVDMGHVFYCAGLTGDFIHRPFDTVEAHVSLLSRILKTEQFDSLVYLSSTRLYDSQPGVLGTEQIPLSLCPTNPRHIYDLSKALGESLCFVAGNGRARVARLSCVYNDHRDSEGFLSGLLRQIIETRPSSMTIDSSPTLARDYIHLQDVLNAIINISQKGRGFLYNVASGENTRNEDLFAALESAGKCQIIPLRNEDSPAPSRISIKKMQDEFDWQPVSVIKKITSILNENL